MKIMLPMKDIWSLVFRCSQGCHYQYLDCQRLPLFHTLPKEGSQLASVCELWSKLAPTLFGGSFLSFSCCSGKKETFLMTLKPWGCDDEMSGRFILCLRKSCSEGPMCVYVVVPEVPSRGSSWNQGGTAPTMQQTKDEWVILPSALMWFDLSSGCLTHTIKKQKQPGPIQYTIIFLKFFAFHCKSHLNLSEVLFAVICILP